MSVSQAVVNALSCKKRSDLDGFLALTDAIFHQIQCSQQQEETLATVCIYVYIKQYVFQKIYN